MDASISLTTYPIWAICRRFGSLESAYSLVGRVGSGSGVGPQPRRGDAAEQAGFVAVGQLPADPDRPDDVVVADKHPAGDRHQLILNENDLLRYWAARSTFGLK